MCGCGARRGGLCATKWCVWKKRKLKKIFYDTIPGAEREREIFNLQEMLVHALALSFQLWDLGNPSREIFSN